MSWHFNESLDSELSVYISANVSTLQLLTNLLLIRSSKILVPGAPRVSAGSLLMKAVDPAARHSVKVHFASAWCVYVVVRRRRGIADLLVCVTDNPWTCMSAREAVVC